jgi:hypothetical protein
MPFLDEKKLEEIGVRIQKNTNTEVRLLRVEKDATSRDRNAAKYAAFS